jgi:hypothetical protein
MSISQFKESYTPSTNIGKDERGDLFTDCHSISARWRNHFTQLMIYTGLRMLSSHKYIQQCHSCPSRVPLILRRLF